MAAQRQVPGGAYVNETGTAQYQVPGYQYVNETSAAAATPYNNNLFWTYP